MMVYVGAPLPKSAMIRVSSLKAGLSKRSKPTNPVTLVDPEGLQCSTAGAKGATSRAVAAARQTLKSIYQAGLRNPNVVRATRLSAVSPQTRGIVFGTVIVGGLGAKAIDAFVPGIYAASGNQPMFPLPDGTFTNDPLKALKARERANDICEENDNEKLCTDLLAKANRMSGNNIRLAGFLQAVWQDCIDNPGKYDESSDFLKAKDPRF